MKRSNVVKGALSAVFLLLLVFGSYTSDAGPAFRYNSYGRRDPFVPLVGVFEEGAKGGVWSILTIDDVVLQGIVVSADGSRSIVVNGEVMSEGERIGRLYVESIGENAVNIKIDEESFELKLYE